MSTHGESRTKSYKSGGSVLTDGDTATKSRDGSSHMSTGTNSNSIEADKELDQFDRLVEKVFANDASVKELVLDNRTTGLSGKIYGSKDLCDALVGNTTVDRLSIRGSNMTDKDAESLAMALMDNTTITHIWLGYNDITSEGVECKSRRLDCYDTFSRCSI